MLKSQKEKKEKADTMNDQEKREKVLQSKDVMPQYLEDIWSEEHMKSEKEIMDDKAS